MKKHLNVCGVGNALVDILLEVSEEEFSRLKLEKATMRLVDTDGQKALLENFEARDLSLVSGGSVANSIIGLAQLGGRGGFICCLGDDRYGFHYRSEFESLGISLPVPYVMNEATGTSAVLITPDAERTMRTCLAVSAHLADKHVNEEVIANSEWVFIEGYIFANSTLGVSAALKAVEIAKRYKTKIALTCSEAWVIQSCGEAFRQVVDEADLVFANEDEAIALAGSKNLGSALVALDERGGNYVVTAGPKGAYVHFDNTKAHVESFPCLPVDLTGAGDMFAGSFLYGITHGINPKDAARAACYMSREVITRVGARLQADVKELWTEALSQAQKK